MSYGRGSALEQEEYVDRCVGMIDDVLDWDNSIHGPMHQEMTAVSQCMTGRCTECGETPGDNVEDEGWKIRHRVYRGQVIVACEGYWMIDPSAVGMEGHENWSAWWITELEADAEDAVGTGPNITDEDSEEMGDRIRDFGDDEDSDDEDN